MKRQLITLCVSSILVGAGIVFNMNQDATVPTVEKVTEDTSTTVSKHEDVDKNEEASVVTQTKKSESKESEKKSTEKSDTQKSTTQQTSTSKSKSKTTSVSSEDITQNSKKESSTKSSSSSEPKITTTSSSNTSTTSSNEVASQPVEKPVEAKQEPVVESTPVPVEPSYACPGGVDQNQACDVILDSNSYYATFSSEGEANSSGEYYLNDVMYIGETEITNYSVQPVYRNDHSIAYYGLNLWSNGSLIH